ncbi:MAG: hypothetical protein ACUVXJ_10885, partial [Phycisphaerae bacterium]
MYVTVEISRDVMVAEQFPESITLGRVLVQAVVLMPDVAPVGVRLREGWFMGCDKDPFFVVLPGLSWVKIQSSTVEVD